MTDKYSEDYYREQGKKGYEKGLKPWKERLSPEDWAEFYRVREEKRQQALLRKKSLDEVNKGVV